MAGACTSRYWPRARRSGATSYRIGGSRPKLTIGPYPEIGIADARDKHAELRALVAKGVDPIKFTRETTAQREAEDRARVTYASFAKQWIASAKPGWWYESAGGWKQK